MQAILQGQRPIDNIPKEGSNNPVKSSGIFSELQRKSNPNLLDNWYFVGGGSQQGGGQFPINQRGETEYATNGYTIDRWLVNGVKAVIDNDGIVLTSNNTNGAFCQKLSEQARAAIKGQTVTLSILLDIGLFSQTAFISEDGNFDLPNPMVGASQWYFDMYTTNRKVDVIFRIINSQADEENPITVIAVKLELGDHQTLAHKEGEQWVLNDPPPNLQQELAKCQRYQIVLNSSGNLDAAVGMGAGHSQVSVDAVILVPVPVEMRVNPTLKYSGKWCIVTNGAIANNIPATNITIASNAGTKSLFYLIVTTERVVEGQIYIFRANHDATARIILDANL